MPDHHPISATTYAQLLEEVLPASGGYARSILRHRQDAEDAVQQTALRGLQALRNYDPRRPFKAWFFAMLRNCCIDSLRARRARAAAECASAPALQQTPSPAEDWEELAAALDRLSGDHADVVRLRYFGGLTYNEMADSLGIPVGTVMSRLHHARLKLAGEMERLKS